MKHSQDISEGKKFLNISAFAKRFEISRPTVYKLIRLNLLTPKMIRRRPFIDCSDDTAIKNAIKELPGVGHYSRSSYYEPKITDPFELAYQAHEREQAEKRLKRKLARLKKCKV